MLVDHVKNIDGWLLRPLVWYFVAVGRLLSLTGEEGARVLRLGGTPVVVSH